MLGQTNAFCLLIEQIKQNVERVKLCFDFVRLKLTPNVLFKFPELKSWLKKN